jgi:hypothetical protein
MAGANSGDAMDDAAARQAAQIAADLSETDLSETGPPGNGDRETGQPETGPPGNGDPESGDPETGRPAGKKRIARRVQAVTGRTTSAAANAAAGARRGADSVVRRGAATARLGADTARKGADTARRGADTARRGADTARRGADSARRGAGSAGRGVTSGVTSGMNWLTAQVLAMGPRLRIRDRATLRAQFPGASDDEIATRLIERAGRASAAVGGTTGAWAALPSLPAFPVEVAAETLAVVGIEVKLVAELHEIYGMAAVGSGTERARAYLGSWASRRGVYQVDGSLLLIAGSPLAKQLTRRLAARLRRSTLSLAPLFTGAVAGAALNRRETRKLGHQMRDELRQRRMTITATVIS